jgi:uncharacterized protein (DUF58 family)
MPATSVDQLFDAAFLTRLETLSLAARQLVRGRMKAERRSTQRGSSVEFAEYRPFVAGDDFRYIDWNAYARWRQLVLKLYVEEQDLYVHLMLDCTASMNWGEPLKFDYARRAAAGLAYLALANLDRVSIVPLGSEAYGHWHPARGRDRFLPLLRWLALCPVDGHPRSLEHAARLWLARKPRRGMVIVVSDLFGADLEDATRALDRVRYARHELAVIQIMDPGEQSAGELGEYELLDTEYGGRAKVIVDTAAAREFRDRFEAYQEGIVRYCRRHHMALLQVSTSLEVTELLLRALQKGGFVR